MYARTHKWQDSIISAQTESVWENIITLGFPCIDARFVLTGYGWKPNASDENLVVLYTGRYDCYYRLSGGSTWTKFATVMSERAAYSETVVYGSTFAQLGTVTRETYEIKIVASDAARFTSWSGTLEGIVSGDQFWSTLKIKTDRPLIINVAESISVIEQMYIGKEELSVSVNDSVEITKELISSELFEPFEFFDVLFIVENISMVIPTLYASAYNTMNLNEYIDLLLPELYIQQYAYVKDSLSNTVTDSSSNSLVSQISGVTENLTATENVALSVA